MEVGFLAACGVLVACVVACFRRVRSIGRVVGAGALVIMLVVLATRALTEAPSGPRRDVGPVALVEMGHLRLAATNQPTPTWDAAAEVKLKSRPEMIVVDPAEGEAVWPFHKSLAADAYPTRDRALKALVAQAAKELREGLARASVVLVATRDEDGLTQELIEALSREAPQLEARPARVPNLARLVRPARDEKLDVERFAKTLATEVGSAIAAQLQDYLSLDPDSVARRALRTAQWAFSSESAVLEVSERNDEHEGTLSARLSYTTLAGQRVERKRFLLAYGEQPWVIEALGPGQSESALYIGRSALEPTPAAALRAARAGAWQRLRDDIQNRVGSRNLSSIERIMLRRGGLDRHIKRHIHRNVGRSWGPQQEFVQTVQLERGPAYRAAVRMTPINLKRMERDVADQAQRAHETILLRVLGLLLLGVLTYGAYRILDAGTRGHFTWRWRLVSVAAFFAVAALALLFAA